MSDSVPVFASSSDLDYTVSWRFLLKLSIKSFCITSKTAIGSVS